MKPSTTVLLSLFTAVALLSGCKQDEEQQETSNLCTRPLSKSARR